MKKTAAALGRAAGKGIAVLAAGIVIGTLLLTLAYRIPVNMENRDASYEVLDREGWYPRTSIIGPGDYFHSFYPDVLDNSSDKIMLSTAMDISLKSPFVRAMESYGEYGGSYSYYWHGYVSILRPLLFWLDYTELRTLNGVCQLLLVLLLAGLIRREKGWCYALALAASYLLLDPRTTAIGLQYTWIFYIAFGGAAVLLSRQKFFREKNRYLYFFLVLGMLTSYLDLLTYPLFTWGFPLIWWIVVQKEERREWEWSGTVVGSGIAWILGYAGMWAAKWQLAALVLKEDICQQAIDEVRMRSGTAEAGMDNLALRWNAIYVNWRHYSYKIYALILALWLVWWIFCTLRKGWCKSSKRYALFLIAVSSAVWYFVLSNHTSLHHFFTYRIYGVSVLALLALALESLGNFRERPRLPARQKLVMAIVTGVSAVLACGGILLAKGDLQVSNGAGKFRQIQMEQMLEMELTPSCNLIRHIKIGLECASTQGRYEVKLWEGEELKAKSALALKDSKEVNYHGLDVWWMLKHGRTYRVTMEALETGAPVSVWLTEAGDMPLTELGEVSIDGRMTGGQLLMGVLYQDWRFTPFELRIFAVLSGFAFLTAALYTFLFPKLSGSRIEV